MKLFGDQILVGLVMVEMVGSLSCIIYVDPKYHRKHPHKSKAEGSWTQKRESQCDSVSEDHSDQCLHSPPPETFPREPPEDPALLVP